MLHRMPKPGDVIQQLSADVTIFVLSCFEETIDKREEVDHSRCIIEALMPCGRKISRKVVFYDNWVFLIDSDISNTNNISKE